MRKSIIVIAIIVVLIAVSATVFLSGCSKKPDLPGVVWGNEEVFTYDVIDQDNGNSKFGTMVMTNKKIKLGQKVNLPQYPQETYEIKSVATEGLLITTEVKNNDGAVIERSESIMDGFVPVASYKFVKSSQYSYTIKGTYDGKRYSYVFNDGDGKDDAKLFKKKIKGYMDNDIMYNILRAYKIESGYTTTFTTYDPKFKAIEKINVSTYKDKSVVKNLKYTNGFGIEKEEAIVPTVQMVFARTTAPKGKNMVIDYTDKEFQIPADLSMSETYSSHIPVRIEEGNLVYTISSVVIK